MSRLPALAALTLCASLHAAEAPQLAQGRAISQAFAQELRAALTQAMLQGGPTQAIEVCASQAPAIARRLSTEHGARITRVSLRPRNPAAAPSDWQRPLLQEFDRLRAAGTPPEQLERLQRANGETRYLRAIPTQPMCLTCHGGSLAPEVKAALATRYPQDQATGYQPGELRGAFSIVWPAATR